MISVTLSGKAVAIALIVIVVIVWGVLYALVISQLSDRLIEWLKARHQ